MTTYLRFSDRLRGRVAPAALLVICGSGPLCAMACSTGRSTGGSDPAQILATKEAEPESVGTTQQALAPAQHVLTRGYDNQRSGWNPQEQVLTTSNVNSQQFGKLFQVSVDDQVYAQVLYAAAVSIGGKVHNVAYVSTVNNTVYAFDADNGASLWTRNFNGSGRPVRNTEVGGACGTYADFSGNIGIVGTPVIGNGNVYFVTRTVDSGLTNYRLHAVDMTTGLERSGSPTSIHATVPGTGSGSNGASITFTASFQNQRTGLALSNGVLYIAFAAYCDTGDYHGWVIAYDATTMAQTGVFNATPNGWQAGIWQSGQAPAIDARGNVWVATGNGASDSTDFGETVLKLAPRTLVPLGYFAPFSVQGDQDLGSAGPIVLPDGSHVVQGGKDGKVYLLDGNNLPSTPAAPGDPGAQVFNAASPENPGPNNHIHAGEALWQSPSGLNLYVWGENAPMHAYRYNAASRQFNTTALAVGDVNPPAGMPGGNLAVSGGSQSGQGIVWALIPLFGDANNATVPGVLRAFHAETLHQIWSSDANPGDDILTFPKFNSPTVVAGKVYAASFSQVVSVFGPRPGPTTPIGNGAYQVRTSVAPGSCLDANTGNAQAGTIERACNETSDQRWQFTNLVNNAYRIQASGSGQCLAVSGGSPGDGVAVEVLPCDGSSGQRWAVTAVSPGQGAFTLSPQTQLPNGPSECLQVANSGAADGTAIQQWGCISTLTPAQDFTLAVDNYGPPAFADGTYRLTTTVAPTASAQCIAVTPENNKWTGVARQVNCNDEGAGDRRWRLRNVGNSSYEVRSAASDLCLDPGVNPSSGTTIPQQACTGASSQRWLVQRVGSGRFMFQSMFGMSIVSSGGQILQSYSGGPGLGVVAP